MRLVSYLLLAIALAAVTGCNKGGSNDWTGIYYYSYEISGTVTSEDGSPIKGILVKSSNRDKVYTDAYGRYDITSTTEPTSSIVLTFIDEDGEENGGRFLSKSLTAEFQNLGGEPHGPYLGNYIVSGLDAVLVSGEVEINPSPDPIE